MYIFPIHVYKSTARCASDCISSDIVNSGFGVNPVDRNTQYSVFVAKSGIAIHYLSSLKYHFSMEITKEGKSLRAKHGQKLSVTGHPFSLNIHGCVISTYLYFDVLNIA